jgi:hypothetical protein
MTRRNCSPTKMTENNDPDRFDLTALLHPAQAFAHPSDVVNDCDLTLAEKRAILASWASDACAVEANPGLRRAPASATVLFDDIIAALRALDRQAAERRKPFPPNRRVLDRRTLAAPGRRSRQKNGNGDQGARLH